MKVIFSLSTGGGSGGEVDAGTGTPKARVK